MRGVDAVEHLRDREVDPVHGAEDRVVERVEADRDPPQPGLGQRPGQRAQGRPVRRQRQVERARRRDGGSRRASRSRSGRSRRTSGSPPVMPQLLDPERRRTARATRAISSNVRTSVARQELVVAAEDLLGHAVGAAEVAAVGHGDAQVAHRPAERVGDARASVEGRRQVHRAHPTPGGSTRGAPTQRSARSGPAPPVPPAHTAGTSSQLHRTSPPLARCLHVPDARPLRPSTQTCRHIEAISRRARTSDPWPRPTPTRLPASVELGPWRRAIRTCGRLTRTTERRRPATEETDAAAMIDAEPATADQVETTGTADLEPVQPTARPRPRPSRSRRRRRSRPGAR